MFTAAIKAIEARSESRRDNLAETGSRRAPAPTDWYSAPLPLTGNSDLMHGDGAFSTRDTSQAYAKKAGGNGGLDKDPCLPVVARMHSTSLGSGAEVLSITQQMSLAV